METNTLLAKAHISQAQAQRLEAGNDASAHSGRERTNSCKSVDDQPRAGSGSTTVEVWLKIDNRAGKLKVGTPVKVSITGQTVEKAMKIPLSAVLTAEDGSKSVMTIDATGKAQSKMVELGISDGTDVQVLSQSHDAKDDVLRSARMVSIRARKCRSAKPAKRTWVAETTSDARHATFRIAGFPARLIFTTARFHPTIFFLCDCAHRSRCLPGVQSSRLGLS